MGIDRVQIALNYCYDLEEKSKKLLDDLIAKEIILSAKKMGVHIGFPVLELGMYSIHKNIDMLPIIITNEELIISPSTENMLIINFDDIEYECNIKIRDVLKENNDEEILKMLDIIEDEFLLDRHSDFINCFINDAYEESIGVIDELETIDTQLIEDYMKYLLKRVLVNKTNGIIDIFSSDKARFRIIKKPNTQGDKLDYKKFKRNQDQKRYTQYLS